MGNGKAAGVVGGVCMAHAPQFFTLPETEDKATVERVHELARENGKRLEALEPDVTIVIANDHANQFLLHCVPPFALHRGKVARGSFAGRDFEFDIASDMSTALVRYLYDENFDISFTSTAELDYAFGIPPHLPRDFRPDHPPVRQRLCTAPAPYRALLRTGTGRGTRVEGAGRAQTRHVVP